MRTCCAVLCPVVVVAIESLASGFQCWHEVQELNASPPTAVAQYGISVAIDQDRLVVGAWQDTSKHPGHQHGAVYVYRRSGETWDFEQKLTAGPGWRNGNKIGNDVAIEGDWIVVGNYWAGIVYFFQFDGASWVERQIVRPTDAGDRFGESVAISGDRVVIGDPDFPDWTNREGAAYVYRFDGSQWQYEATLTASDAVTDMRFGGSVTISGTSIVVGTWDGEAAYYFSHDGTSWNEQQKIVAADPELQGMGFGWDVSLDGEWLMVGAPWDDDFGNQSGSAYFFRKVGASFTESEKHSGDLLQSFGFAVSVEGDLAVATGAGAVVGRTAVFRLHGDDWQLEADLYPPDPDVGDHFGWSVAVGPEVAVIGAPDENVGDLWWAGSVYSFTSGPAAEWENYGEGYPGTLGIPGLVIGGGDPVLGSNCTLEIGNSSIAPTVGLMFVGPDQASLDSGWGGALLVQIVTGPATLPLSATGSSLPLDIPDEPAFCGLELYWQVLEADPGATKGVSFTPGLRMRLGR